MLEGSVVILENFFLEISLICQQLKPLPFFSRQAFKFINLLALSFINCIGLDKLPTLSGTQFPFLNFFFFSEITVPTSKGCYEVERKGM